MSSLVNVPGILPARLIVKTSEVDFVIVFVLFIVDLVPKRRAPNVVAALMSARLLAKNQV